MTKFKNWFTHFRRTPAFAGSILFLVALILNAVLQGPSFFTVRSFNTLCAKNMPLILVTIAQAVLLLAGTMDISCGIQVALVNVVIIMTGQEWGLPFGVCCLLGMLASIAASAACWLCCSIFRLPALLASFALTYVIKGINVLIMDVPQGKIDKVFYKFYDSQILGFIPMSLMALVIAMLIWTYCKHTKFGTNIYAVGSNPRNAFAAGISPVKVQFQAFMIKGIFVGLAGICITLMIASGNPLQAEDYGLRSLSACIIGGLGFGGWGSVACGFFGASFYVLIQNSVYYFFTLLGKLIPGFAVTSYWQNFASDIIVLLGLLMTIVTAKGQREALKQGIVRQFKGESTGRVKDEKKGGAGNE
ncbi:MAG: ABC transporter permease [Candidatus Limivicinus sp.]|jgi:ribose transport system permease protein